MVIVKTGATLDMLVQPAAADEALHSIANAFVPLKNISTLTLLFLVITIGDASVIIALI